jgi:hypothetical protein
MDQLLNAGLDAYLQIFGARLPNTEAELEADLFYENSELANTVAAALRQYGYDGFVAALRQRFGSAPR